MKPRTPHQCPHCRCSFNVEDNPKAAQVCGNPTAEFHPLVELVDAMLYGPIQTSNRHRATQRYRERLVVDGRAEEQRRRRTAIHTPSTPDSARSTQKHDLSTGAAQDVTGTMD